MSALAPSNTDTTSEPSVGIFWRVAGALVVDRTPLSRAEPYGDCLTHGPGHYEQWEAWQRLGVRGLREQGHPDAIRVSEYDEWPRGRVVYEVPSARFVLYADRRLQQLATLTALRTAFGLDAATVIVRGDPHYR
ncbi:hypothetical protein [Methylobacterium sp. J-092]|uniref:hypothetical protein n=1 Tax=Methylobacterium sp. J-092 TaxID=2836667 RepID=UPI001FB9AB62|nr:hypothetical protein [Methylobacterium sp. J-092]MCJ2007957.1 hypothetical protein [Methylobacterium sp. J-092]